MSVKGRNGKSSIGKIPSQIDRNSSSSSEDSSFVVEKGPSELGQGVCHDESKGGGRYDLLIRRYTLWRFKVKSIQKPSL